MTIESPSPKDVFLLLFLVPLENFSLIWRRHHYRWRAANFDLCSALLAIEQWWSFSVSHLLWHGASVYNGHHTYYRAFDSGAAAIAFYDLALSRLGFEHITLRLRGHALTHCATAAVQKMFCDKSVEIGPEVPENVFKCRQCTIYYVTIISFWKRKWPFYLNKLEFPSPEGCFVPCPGGSKEEAVIKVKAWKVSDTENRPLFNTKAHLSHRLG